MAWMVGKGPLNSMMSSRRVGGHSSTPRFATVEKKDTTTTSSLSSSQKSTNVTQLRPEFEAAMNVTKEKMQSSIPPELAPKMEMMMSLLDHFLQEYMVANQKAYLAGNTEDCHPMAVAKRFLTAIQYGLNYGMGPNKYKFDVTHRALRGIAEQENGNTIDYYAFGCDFFRPVMDLANSKVLGLDTLKKAMAQLEAGGNVVFLANHQSEADPQVMSVCMEMVGYKQQGEDMVYVAGHKVTTDPLAVPFSMGRNLICIHSKKHINADPETKSVKQRQNLKAMGALMNKFKEGGCLLWVAPSGGRDRRNVETGDIPIAPFDSKTIDMFRLMGNKSGVPTHFYPLAMATYNLCPPPDFLDAGVGEQRNIRFVPVGIAVGEEVPNIGGLESRHEFCDHAFKECEEDYAELLKSLGM